MDVNENGVRDEQTFDASDVGSASDLLDTSGVADGGEPALTQLGSADSKPETITDINELDAVTEPLGDVDEAKLEELMTYAPTLAPGKFHFFTFKLDEEKPVESRIIKGKTEAQFNYVATLVDENGNPGKSIKYCSANTFRSGKMEASRLEELLFSLGKLRKFKATGKKASDALALLQEAEGEQRVFRGLVQWRFYDNESGMVMNTHPAKPYTKTNKDGTKTQVVEQPWPRNADGSFARHEGNEEIRRVQPTEETLAELHAEDGGQSAA